MAEVETRIAQFKQMADADPTNELGHYSLGKAYLDAGRQADALASFQKALDLNANLSKVYQLMAGIYLDTGNREQAIDKLTAGVKIADARGDLMPKNEMIATLQQLGAPIPELQKSARRDEPVGEGQIICKRCGRLEAKLAKPPFRGPFGQEIFDNICALCWKEAIAMGTKVINELRLPLADPHRVAESGINAMFAGRATHVPGLVNKILAFLGQLPPRRISVEVNRFLLRP